ncbi:hypothetical protein HDU98_009409 [Podochytrium sp. JEL0797]|nr:hypothetical protein HDU98_009409 [Podochytrium sp. JEL0797]
MGPGPMGGMGAMGGMMGGMMGGNPMMGGGDTQRTLYIGGLHPDATPKDICDVLRGGLVQKVNFLSEKNTAFVTFIDPSAAVALYLRGSNEGIVIKGKRVKIGWDIGPLDPEMTELTLRADFSTFGEIELIHMVPEKKIAFVSFTDIASAIKVVEGGELQQAFPAYAPMRVNYGKDRLELTEHAFLEIMVPRLSLLDSDDMIRQMFVSLDLQGNGFITLHNLKPAI